MARIAARGVDALIGLSIEQPADDFNVGHPLPVVRVIAAPSAPTTSDGGAGNITGTVTHYATRVAPDGETVASVGSTPLVLSSKKADLYLAVSTDSTVYATRWYRSESTHSTPYWVGTSWANGTGLGTPDAPTGASGPSGTKPAGDYKFKVAWRTAYAETIAGTASAAVTAGGSNKLTVTQPTPPATAVYWRVYCSKVGVYTTYYEDSGWLPVATSTYDSDTADAALTVPAPSVEHVYYSDNLALDSSSLNFYLNPPTYNETGANAGFCFTYPESFDGEPDWAVIEVPELRGTAFKPRGAPGMLDLQWTLKRAMRGGMAVPTLAMMMGKPTITRHSDGMSTYVFTVKPAASAEPYSNSICVWPGGQLRPTYLWNAMASAIDIDVSAGKVVDENVKGQALHYTQCGIGEWHSTPGAYTTVPVVRGIRNDAAAATTSLITKITSNPSAGTFGIKTTLHGDTYGSTEYTVPYNTTSYKQKRSASVNVDWVELWDKNDVALGGDDNELRRPFSILYPGTVTALSTSTPDEFLIPYQALIPGKGTTPGTSDGTYTGYPARSVLQPRYTMAHASILRGTGSATDSLEFQDCKFNLAWAFQPIESAGKDAGVYVDFERSGYCTTKLSFGRRFTDREFEWLLARDQRYVVQFALTGARPLVQPGTISTRRESITFDLGQLRISGSPKRPISGPNLIIENVDTEGESPDNTAVEGLTVTVVTRQYWSFPS